MNEFYLIIIKTNGDIIHNAFATSHKDLISKYITPDDDKNRTYFKAQYSPKDGYRLDDISNYILTINETYIPEWFVGDFKESIMRKLNAIIESMIIRGRRQLLLHEGAILVGNSYIEEIKHSIVFAMYDNSRVKILDFGSEVQVATDDSIIEELRDCTKVLSATGFAKIFEMRHYSKVIKLSEHAEIRKMCDHSRILVLNGDANIQEMHETAQADQLKHMSKVSEMHGHSVIEEMRHTTLVEKMFDSSRVNLMYENAKVEEMYGNSTIDHMTDNSIVGKLFENSLVKKLESMAKVLEKELKN